MIDASSNTHNNDMLSNLEMSLKDNQPYLSFSFCLSSSSSCPCLVHHPHVFSINQSLILITLIDIIRYYKNREPSLVSW